MDPQNSKIRQLLKLAGETWPLPPLPTVGTAYALPSCAERFATAKPSLLRIESDSLNANISNMHRQQ